VMHADHTRKASNEERTKGGAGSSIEEADRGGKSKADDERKRHVELMLPPCQAVFLKIAHPCERRVGSTTKEEPAYVRMEKSFRNIVGIFVMIYEFVVASVISAPSESRALERSRAEE